MKLSNKTITERLQGLMDLSQRQLPIKASYAIAKNLEKFKKEFDTVQKIRIETMKKYSELNEDGSVKSDEQGLAIFKSDEDKKKFQDDLDVLMNEENEIEVRTITLDHLGNKDFTPNELLTLDFMLEE